MTWAEVVKVLVTAVVLTLFGISSYMLGVTHQQLRWLQGLRRGLKENPKAGIIVFDEVNRLGLLFQVDWDPWWKPWRKRVVHARGTEASPGSPEAYN